MTKMKPKGNRFESTTTDTNTAPLIFISYSHVDEIWKDELRSQLAEARLQVDITVWDDRQIEPTDEWYQTIRGVMAQTTAAICLIRRCGMRLFEVNVHLEHAFFNLDKNNKDKARKHLEAATAMIDDIGFHRWDQKITELRIAIG